jgi:hypothetical protein
MLELVKGHSDALDLIGRTLALPCRYVIMD